MRKIVTGSAFLTKQRMLKCMILTPALKIYTSSPCDAHDIFHVWERHIKMAFAQFSTFSPELENAVNVLEETKITKVFFYC